MKKNVLYALKAAAFLSVALCFISFLPFARHAPAPKAFQSALLNPSCKDTVSKIILEQGGRKLSLHKDGMLWLVSDGTIIAPASKSRVVALIQSFVKLRKMYKISDSNTDAASGVDFYALSFYTDATDADVFTGINEKLYTKIYIYPSLSLSDRVALRAESRPSVYETEDDLSYYCTTTLSAFADERLFCALDTIVSADALFRSPGHSCAGGSGGAGAIGALRASGSAGSVHVAGSAAAALGALRHGGLFPAEPLPSALPVAEICVSDANGRLLSMQIFENRAAEDVSYRCAAAFLASPVDGAAEQRALQSFSYQAEISGWTYSRLQGIFTEEK